MCPLITQKEFEPVGAEIVKFREKYVNGIAVHALVPCVANASVPMLSTR